MSNWHDMNHNRDEPLTDADGNPYPSYIQASYKELYALIDLHERFGAPTGLKESVDALKEAVNVSTEASSRGSTRPTLER